MKHLYIVIDPTELEKASIHLLTIEGHFVTKNVFLLEIQENVLTSAINAIEYILAGFDYQLFIK